MVDNTRNCSGKLKSGIRTVLDTAYEFTQTRQMAAKMRKALS